MGAADDVPYRQRLRSGFPSRRLPGWRLPTHTPAGLSAPGHGIDAELVASPRGNADRGLGTPPGRSPAVFPRSGRVFAAYAVAPAGPYQASQGLSTFRGTAASGSTFGSTDLTRYGCALHSSAVRATIAGQLRFRAPYRPHTRSVASMNPSIEGGESRFLPLPSGAMTKNSALWGKVTGRLAVLLLIAAAFAVAGGASWVEAFHL